MRKILILGANGFIGRNISSVLAREKDVVLTLFSRSIDAIKYLERYENVTIIQGDYTNILNLVSIIKKQDLIYHLISASVPSTSWSHPTLEVQKNLLPTLQLLKLCSDLDVKKVVYISSGGTVYGEQDGVLNESSKLQPFSPYGIIKTTIEHFFEYYRKKENLNYDIYRLSNPYGIGLEKIGFGVINTWLRAAAQNKPITVFGDGRTQKDFIYIDDAIQLMLYSVKHPLDKSDIFNISLGQTISLKQIIEVIQKVTKIDLHINYEEGLVSDNKLVKLDNSKILQYFPTFEFTSLEKGIEVVWEKVKLDS